MVPCELCFLIPAMMLSLTETFMVAVMACCLDRCVGDPRRLHPVAGFGALARRIETSCRAARAKRPRLVGVVAWVTAVAPPVLAVALACAALGAVARMTAQDTQALAWPRLARDLVELVCLYFALGAQSLAQHGLVVSGALCRGDLPAARRAVGLIVSRDTRALDATGVSRAAVESILENGSDAVFAALFWFVAVGAPGVVLYRCANTLDAMWGYRNARYRDFGWAAARLDDAFNYVPARLTALTYAALGRRRDALRCWRGQARDWDSPNAGPVMAAGAGALGVRLGGAAVYFGQTEARASLGLEQAPTVEDIDRAIRLVRRGQILWLGLLGLIAWALRGHA